MPPVLGSHAEYNAVGYGDFLASKAPNCKDQSLCAFDTSKAPNESQAACMDVQRTVNLHNTIVSVYSVPLFIYLISQGLGLFDYARQEFVVISL